MANQDQSSSAPLTPLDRFLRLFSDVRGGEGVGVLLMFANVFLILLGYYIIKTVREPLILTGGGAAVKTYASAGQALALIAFIPIYSWLAARLKRSSLIVALNLFFVACIILFEVAIRLDVRFVGVVFYIWVGIFNLSIIAQFWSYANDIYTKEMGERLFPVIAIGATLGSPIGAKIAGQLFKMGQPLHFMLRLSGAILLVSLGLYYLMNHLAKARQRTPAAEPVLAKGDGFALVFKSSYLLAIGVLLIMTNLVNTAGEFLLSTKVTEAAASLADKKAFIGGFYGDYLFWTSVLAALLQAFVASRLVKAMGLRGVLLALPIVALGSYSIMAAGAGLMLVRLAKIAENGTDYSLMNTAKQLLWLPTSREEKYKAKQAIDTFFVRSGDVLAAVLVFVGTTQLGLGIRGFAVVNLALVALWLFLAFRVLKLNAAETSKAAA